MWFWVKHLSFAVVLIVLAIYFLVGEGPTFDIRDSKNAAAEGLSRFYASIKNQAKSDEERDKYVLQLKTPEQTLDTVLAERTRIVSPMPPNWVGSVEPRRFENGSTLKKVLSAYADKEGIVMYWYLSKDYVVKEHFRVDGNFTSALYQVGRAINDDFEYEVYTYLCFKQRAAVITEKPSEFVRANCLKLKT
ncbi:toxin co-regulated pilus biosynthesis Q family protein [Pseudoalteromonas sp. TB64]|uniref:toxin co-regulated pilus biosynthesis Q family protein n=1 Tax=Pseudoalteromonas sp. TB64 TaxID=1938600 RepID=UPI0003FA67B4|nr:toxin co-regulated pilus biosynthesis Q family protein [Pseudoalteromonas sp. TB64]